MIERKVLQKPVAAFVYRRIGLKLEGCLATGLKCIFRIRRLL